MHKLQDVNHHLMNDVLELQPCCKHADLQLLDVLAGDAGPAVSGSPRAHRHQQDSISSQSGALPSHTLHLLSSAADGLPARSQAVASSGHRQPTPQSAGALCLGSIAVGL